MGGEESTLWVQLLLPAGFREPSAVLAGRFSLPLLILRWGTLGCGRVSYTGFLSLWVIT